MATNSDTAAETGTVSGTIFKAKPDRFKCITIDTRKVKYSSDEDFEEKLQASVAAWKEQGIRGVWAKINIAHSTLVPICIKHGFIFHHAQSKYLMCKQWLSETETDTLPDYANHYLGAAGFVVNDKNQVLVIQERFHTKPHWKLPGGHADTGEDVAEAAVREVFEETGVKAEFQSVICFRHQHNYRWGTDDFYFICLMKALTEDIVRCEKEISKVQWMDVKEYCDSPEVSDANRLFARCYLDMKENGGWQIQPSPVISYDGKCYHQCYSIQSSNVSNQKPPSNI